MAEQHGAIHQHLPSWIMPELHCRYPTLRFHLTALASTFVGLETETYVYHQLNGSTFAEDLWDGTSETWISSNFTINTA